MKTDGAPKRRLVASLVPQAELIVDVGADHGHIAHAVGAVATEREPGRAGRPDVPWVIADGLTAFRHVPVAIIAGMGAHTIADILDAGPLPDILIAHAPDDPQKLRTFLAARGYRIDAEGLAPESRRFAEVIRVVRGQEPHSGLELEFGPLLLQSDDPYLRPHLEHLHRHFGHLARVTRDRVPDKHAIMHARTEFLATKLTERGWLGA